MVIFNIWPGFLSNSRNPPVVEWADPSLLDHKNDFQLTEQLLDNIKAGDLYALHLGHQGAAPLNLPPGEGRVAEPYASICWLQNGSEVAENQFGLFTEG